jgi:hypothetical protein
MFNEREFYFGTAAAVALRDHIERVLGTALRKDNRSVLLKRLATECDRFAKKAPSTGGGTDPQGNVIDDPALWAAISELATELRPWDHRLAQHNLLIEAQPAIRRQLLLTVIGAVYGMGGKDLLDLYGVKA